MYRYVRATKRVGAWLKGTQRRRCIEMCAQPNIRGAWRTRATKRDGVRGLRAAQLTISNGSQALHSLIAVQTQPTEPWGQCIASVSADTERHARNRCVQQISRGRPRNTPSAAVQQAVGHSIGRAQGTGSRVVGTPAAWHAGHCGYSNSTPGPGTHAACRMPQTKRTCAFGGVEYPPDVRGVIGRLDCRTLACHRGKKKNHHRECSKPRDVPHRGELQPMC